MIRITKDLNAEVVETGDPERTEENLNKSHENYSKYSVNPWSHVTVHWQGIFLFTSHFSPLFS